MRLHVFLLLLIIHLSFAAAEAENKKDSKKREDLQPKASEYKNDKRGIEPEHHAIPHHLNLQEIIEHHKPLVIERVVHVPVHVPHPYPVEHVKHVPYPVQVPVPVEVRKPYPVPVPQPYHVHVPKKVPVHVEKHVPYEVKVPVKVPFSVPVEVPVHHPYPVHVEKPYEVPVKVPIHQSYVVPVHSVPVHSVPVQYSSYDHEVLQSSPHGYGIYFGSNGVEHLAHAHYKREEKQTDKKTSQ